MNYLKQKCIVDFLTSEKSSDHPLDKIIPAGTLNTFDAWSVYQNDYQARMFEALSQHYEMTWCILGDEQFHNFIKMYLKLERSKSQSLNDFGLNLPLFFQERRNELLQNGIVDSDNEWRNILDLLNFESEYWQAFHLETFYSNLRPDLDQFQWMLKTNPIDLSKLKLFHSNLQLKYIWDHRIEGTLDPNEVFQKSYTVLHPGPKGVTMTSLSNLQFNFFEELSDKKIFSHVNGEQYGFSVEDWKKNYAILITLY